MANREETLNSLVVWLLKDIMRLEETWLITDEFKDVTNNDMHVMEAIGTGEPKNMTTVAKLMMVTTGTLTKSVEALVRKKYVHRERSEEDKRVVLISLTEKGQKAYRHHEEFHQEMMKQLTRGMKEEEIQILINTLAKMKDHFAVHSKIDKLMDFMMEDDGK